jgi:hypothetical protein
MSSLNVRPGGLLARPTIIVRDVFDDREGGKGGLGGNIPSTLTDVVSTRTQFD